MAISATLQLFGSQTSQLGGGTTRFVENNDLAKVFKDIYTVLKLDYTFARKVNDRTNRPEGKPYIKEMKVTIRATKESKATFHQWMQATPVAGSVTSNNGMIMKGEIKIYDSAGILSSSVQDATGISPLVDLDEETDFVISEIGGDAMTTGMDDASDYENRDFDMYDELSHAQLLKQAREKGIVVNSRDSDDDIRNMLREWENVKDKDIPEIKVGKNKKSLDDMTLSELETYANDHDIEKKDFKDETEKMKEAELDKYLKDNGINLTEKETLENKREKVRTHMELAYYKEKTKNCEKGKLAREAQEEAHVKQMFTQPAYKEGDKWKAKTVSSVKGAGKAAAKRLLECARCIAFEEAFCISLKEVFTNDPDSTGKLNKYYPWIIEIGILPKKVTVTGEQIFGQTTKEMGLVSSDVNAVFDGLYQ